MYNVLVCDDDKEIVEAIEIYLKREGYNILKAYKGSFKNSKRKWWYSFNFIRHNDARIRRN